MISPKYHQIKQVKQNRYQLKSLKQEVQKSRVAVQNITKFKSTQNKYKWQLTTMQQELQSCIINLNIESKKYKLLNNLITILKYDFMDYQQTKKKQDQAYQTIKQKTIKKYQYQIDQILQKHNQQVAKIHNLKDLANSRRSQRVVYSSLFKKLQKQIKHHQQVYKQQLMISQQVKSNKKQFNNNNKGVNQKQNSQCDNKKSFFDETTQFQFQVLLQKQQNTHKATQNQWNGFLTAHKDQHFRNSRNVSHSQRKFYAPNDGRDERQPKESIHRQQKYMHTKQLLRKISEYTNQIQKLKIYSEAQNTQQMLDFYSHVEVQNQNLLVQISQCDIKIEQILKETSQIIKKINEEQLNSKMKQVDEDLSPVNILQYSLKNITNSKGKEESTNLCKKVISIFQLLSIPLQQNSQCSINQLCLNQLDRKIQMINKQYKRNMKKRSLRREDTIYEENVVDVLLDKMEKYGNSQKIQDRASFQREYYEQLKKKKHIRSRKQASR